jgi:hypothetical protein
VDTSILSHSLMIAHFFGYVYLIRCKSGSFEKFKEYSVEVENQTRKQINALRLDCDGEYLLGEFKNYLVHMR